MNNGNGYAPTSLEAWNQYNSEIIPLNDHLAIEVAGYDVMALLTGGSNPLLAILQDLVEKDAEGKPQLDSINEAALLDKPEKLAALSAALDQLLIDIVISPPLKEQGNANGYPLVRIPFNYKMKVFEYVSGGEQALTAAERFHPAETTSLVIASTGIGIRSEAEPN